MSIANDEKRIKLWLVELYFDQKMNNDCWWVNSSLSLLPNQCWTVFVDQRCKTQWVWCILPLTKLLKARLNQTPFIVFWYTQIYPLYFDVQPKARLWVLIISCNRPIILKLSIFMVRILAIDVYEGSCFTWSFAMFSLFLFLWYLVSIWLFLLVLFAL